MTIETTDEMYEMESACTTYYASLLQLQLQLGKTKKVY